MAYVPSYAARRIYWATQETIAEWLSTASNTAGSFDLATDGVLVCGRRSRSATLIWTTVDLWAMTYIGGTLVYAFQQVGTNCGIISKLAPVVLDSGAYWMGRDRFYHFDGAVRQIPCDVIDYVFGNFNHAQSALVWALANPTFGEVTWFYPSSGSSTADSYVTFNYQDGHWVFGVLSRAVGITQQAGAATQVPVMVDSFGRIYDHETGDARTVDGLGAHLTYAESGPIELGDGDQVMRVQRIVPDDKTLGDVTASIYTSLAPDATETANGPYTLASQTSVRLTARQVRLKITEAVATAWRVGSVRLGVVPGGRR